MEQMQETPISLVERSGKSVLVLQGNVDVFWAEKLHQTALHIVEHTPDVMIECGNIEQLSSAALQILLALRIRVQQGGGRFSLENVPDTVHQQLQMTGLGVLSSNKAHDE